METMKVNDANHIELKLKHEALAKEHDSLTRHHKELSKLSKGLEERIADLENKDFLHYKEMQLQIERVCHLDEILIIR
jgi:hypothetical protein